SKERLPVHRPEQFTGAGRPGYGTDDGPADRARAVRRGDRGVEDAERGRRTEDAAHGDARAHRAEPDRETRAVAGVDGGYGRSYEPASACVAFVGGVSGKRDHSVRHAGSVQGGAAELAVSGRCGDRVVDGLED